MANNSVTTQKNSETPKTDVKRGRPNSKVRMSGPDKVEYLLPREQCIRYLQCVTLYLCDQSPNKGEFPKLTDFGGEPPARQGIFSVSEKDKPLTVMNMMLIIQAGRDASDNEGNVQ